MVVMILNILFPQEILKGTFSIPKKNQIYIKAKFHLLEIQKKKHYQFSFYTNQQVFHKNILYEDLNTNLNNLLENDFDSLELQTKDAVYGYKISKKGKLLTNKRNISNAFISLEHNKKKNYLLNEGNIIPPLIDLGVMTTDGMIVKAKYDKYRQINRFLEIIDDTVSTNQYLKIIDFGCGKSYLTFLLYYYLTEVKKIECDIIGLDLKTSVVEKCNEIAAKYGYQHLHFLKGNISDYKEEDHIDMIITLHACDTATDYALYHAIKMNCKYIFSVPCCQHEINQQLKTNKFHLVSKYGILKERMAAIMTDAIRANILQYYGYKTQVLEFVDMENSPKNILIRASYENLPRQEKIKKEIEELIQYFDAKQTLYDLTISKEE